MLNKTILQSKVIDLLRFPLIVGVVLIHSQLGELKIGDSIYAAGLSLPFYMYISKLLSQILASVAVPLFFLISGFLFFYKSDFSLRIYINKLRKRIKTLLIPYIFWNVVVIILFYLAQSIFPDLISGNNKLIKDYNLIDYFSAFWCISDSKPICYQFWFIRDLMVIVLFTPILFFFIKRLKFSCIILILILWFFNFTINIPGFSISSLLFFIIGAYFSIMKYNLIKVSNFALPYSFVGYFIVVLLELYTENNWKSVYLHKIGIILGCISVFSLTAYMIKAKNWKINNHLQDSSFFIYAYHGMVLTFIMKIMMKWLRPTEDITFLVVYFLSPLITIVAGVFLYSILREYFPKFTTIITGGR